MVIIVSLKHLLYKIFLQVASCVHGRDQHLYQNGHDSRWWWQSKEVIQSQQKHREFCFILFLLHFSVLLYSFSLDQLSLRYDDTAFSRISPLERPVAVAV